MFWLLLQVRSLEASIALWEWTDTFYITLKSTCMAGGRVLGVTHFEGSQDRWMQLHKDYFYRSHKAGGNQGGFGTHGSRAEKLLQNKEFGVIFMNNFK